MKDLGTLFVLPQNPQIAPSSTRAPTSASNMLHDEMALTWRSTGLDGVSLVLTGAGVWDTIALVGTNLRSTDTIRVRAATTNSGLTIGPDYDATFPAYTGAAKATGAMVVHCLDEAVSLPFIRIDITAPGHPAGFIEVSNLILGKAVEWDGIDQGAEVTFDNATTSYLRKYQTKPTWKITLSGISQAAWFNVWEDFCLQAGQRGGFLFVPIYNDEFMGKRSAYVNMVGSPKLTYITSDILNVEMTVTTIQ